jgi:uncharacterized membrane protein YhaH (DUF805 family)
MRARDRMTPRIGRPWPALLAAPVLLTLLLVCASEISWMALRTQFSVEPPSIALEPVQPSSDSASVALVQGLPQPFNDSEPPSVTHAPPVWLEISMTAVGSIATLAWLACFTVWCALPRRRLRDVYLAALLAVVIDQTIALALEMPLMAYIESDPDRSVEAMHRIYLVGGSAVGLSSIAIAAALAWTFLRRLQRDAVWPSKPRISPDDSAARA